MGYQARTYELKSRIERPRSEVWEVLCNTDRINKAIGLAPVKFESKPVGGSASIREAHGKFAGIIPMDWKEYPFQWIKNERYSVLRVYESGPIARFLGGIEMEDAPDGQAATNVRIFSEFTPANALGNLFIPIVARQMLAKTLAACKSYLLDNKISKPVFAMSVFPDTPTDMQVLEQAATRLKELPLDAQCVRRLVEYVHRAGDNDVTAMQPYRLAEQWGASRHEVLRACLYATKSGLLNLTWSLMCPNCRVPVNQISSLGKLTEQIHCDFCGVAYDTDFDRYVELRFNVHPAIRPAVAQVYCIGGPFMAPHVLAQQSVPKGELATLNFPEVDDELRLRVLRAPHRIAILDNATSKKSDEIVSTYTDEGWLLDEIARPEPRTKLSFINQSSGDITLDLEKVEWDPYAVTALMVTAMQEFRDMFSSEVLAPGQHIGVENLTLFFSDLRGSTDMYEQVGDAPAYGRVRRHFTYLFECIGDNNGSVVKTIGDAVMAVFQTPTDAMRAALSIQRDIVQFNNSLHDGGELSIKIGLHHGPAICVNSNDKIDYFGRTVNIAARTTSQCKGDDIVLSDAVRNFPGVEELLTQSGITIEPFQVCLKGIAGDYPLHRVICVNGSCE